MRDLLFLAHRIPFPPDKGDKLRAYNILRELSRTYRVHLGCFVDDAKDMEYVAHLRKICATVFAVRLNKHRALVRGLYGLASGSSLSEWYFRDRRMDAWI